MATVRITNNIRYYVKQKLEALYADRIKKKHEELNHLDIGMACYNRHIPHNFRTWASELNKDPDGEWMEEHQSIGILITYGNPPIEVGFCVPLNPPVPLPKRFHRWGGSTFRLLPDMEPYKHAVEILTAETKLREEQKSLIQAIVGGVLKECTTLRQVLEHWPTALEFMPDDVREVHNRAVEKKTRDKPNIEIGDDIKMSLIKARMIASGDGQ